MRRSISISILWFLDSWILGIGETSLQVYTWFKAYLTSRRTLFQPHEVLSPAGAITGSSKGHSIILLSQLFQDGGNITIPEKSMSMRPMLYFICYKVSLFVRGNVVWNTMKVNKAFCKPADGSFSRNSESRKEKTISSINVFSSENKELLLQWWKWSSVINLIPGGWLVPPGNGAILGAQCWYLLLAGWVLSSGSIQIGLGEWKSVLLSPYTGSISASMIIVFMSQLSKYGD